MTAVRWLLPLVMAVAGCSGGGPLGNGLGEVVATIKVTDASGKTCQVDVANGKDQTNLSLTDLSVCGGHLGSLHADRSDGAQAAIAANAAVANHAIDVGAGLVGAALTATGVPHGVPKPVPTVPPVVVPPVVVPPPPPPPLAARPTAALQEFLTRRLARPVALESSEP